MPPPAAPIGLHATAVVVRAAGVLIRGPSGSGKSSLALALLDRARQADWFAQLVGDDRVLAQAIGGRLLVQPHPSIAGRIERRGSGLLAVPYLGCAVMRMIVDLDAIESSCAKAPRLPEAQDLRSSCCGIDLPRIIAGFPVPVSDIAAEVLRVVLRDEG